MLFSLRQLLADKSPLLLADTASTLVQAAFFPGNGQVPRRAASSAQAGSALFETVGAVLDKVPFAEVRAVVFCEGPGSTLGIRTAAAACRAWRVVNPSLGIFAYKSLELVSAALNRPGAAVICDARRDSWHFSMPGQPLRRVPTAELPRQAADVLLMPEHFATWTPMPAGVATTPYDLETLWQAAADRPLIAPSDAPDAFLHEQPAYVTWTRQVHQAAVPKA